MCLLGQHAPAANACTLHPCTHWNALSTELPRQRGWPEICGCFCRGSSGRVLSVPRPVYDHAATRQHPAEEQSLHWDVSQDAPPFNPQAHTMPGAVEKLQMHASQSYNSFVSVKSICLTDLPVHEGISVACVAASTILSQCVMAQFSILGNVPCQCLLSQPSMVHKLLFEQGFVNCCLHQCATAEAYGAPEDMDSDSQLSRKREKSRQYWRGRGGRRRRGGSGRGRG